VRKLFEQRKPSEERDNIYSMREESDVGSFSGMNPYNYDASTLPGITLPVDTNSSIHKESAYGSPDTDEALYRSNLQKLKKIRNSVRSVERLNFMNKTRLYQGIIIISKKEFYIDIFKTKIKFYISAIELSTKTPYMIELYINQAKKILKE